MALAQLDPSAFAPLYRRYVRSIYAFCYQRLGSKELAEDATSQVFANSLASLPRYRFGSFRGWLYAIARNVVTDERRRPVAIEAPSTQPSQGARALAAQYRLVSDIAVRSADGRLSISQQRTKTTAIDTRAGEIIWTQGEVAEGLSCAMFGSAHNTFPAILDGAVAVSDRTGAVIGATRERLRLRRRDNGRPARRHRC